jgi:hypothetical protein
MKETKTKRGNVVVVLGRLEIVLLPDENNYNLQ